MTTKNVKLILGYTDKENNKHFDVEFGKRPKVSDLMFLDTNPQAKNADLDVV